MYVILVYDVDQKRTAKMLKLCRRYLSWIQNSVFEGEISEVQLKGNQIYHLAFHRTWFQFYLSSIKSR